MKDSNILFYEGVKLIINQLEEFKVLKWLYEISNFEPSVSKEDIKIKMTDEWKQKHESKINKKFIYNFRIYFNFL